MTLHTHTVLLLVVTVATALVGSTSAFAPDSYSKLNVRITSSPSSSSLSMAPRFDTSTERWFADVPEEMNGSSYGPIGSLYRAGPKPFLQRIFNPDTYDQAVLKYMAQDGCDRKEAQGNMDAFLENPQDWAYQKMEEKKGAAKKDYANANMAPQQVILTTVWACVVVVFFYDLVTGVAEGRYGKTDGNDIFHGNLWSLPF
eukprot:CAMPEP_0183714092 /NCGR_PEP_ID=MMETSP0737-20130205/8761_1 /TAXON_ID=385413 /ORGANISM="Thalassiosira miniscula, Strain CCMP1093" /LENGTH=199 /DNA_ID=CAMNT_0025942997 /DNA_START=115 /DNA_END=714 /DNA_ORIENTATION=+